MLKAVAGGGGKGMRTVGVARRPAVGAARGTLRGAVGVWRRRGVPGTAARASAPRRGAVAGRRAWHRGAVCRARVLDPAPASEGARGKPVACRVDRAARGAGRGRAKGGRLGGLHQRRHHRVPARRRRTLLLPRDEHAAAGRAPNHGSRHGRRPGAVAVPPRARRAPDDRPAHGRRAARPRRRVPHLRRGSGLRLSAVTGPADPPASAIGSGRARRRRVRRAGRGADSLRLAGLEADHLGHGPARGDRPHAAGAARVRDRGRQDDHSVFHLAARRPGLPGLARRHDVSRPRAGGAKRDAVCDAGRRDRGPCRARRGARRVFRAPAATPRGVGSPWTRAARAEARR